MAPKRGKNIKMFFSRICKAYQQCARCVEHDHVDDPLPSGAPCNWNEVTYEVGWDLENGRMDCDENTNPTGCVTNMCSVSF